MNNAKNENKNGIKKRKKQEKLLRIGRRRQSFFKVFLRTFTPVIITAIVLCFFGTLFLKDAYESEKTVEFDNYYRELVDRVENTYYKWQSDFHVDTKDDEKLKNQNDDAKYTDELSDREELMLGNLYWVLCTRMNADQLYGIGKSHCAAALYNVDDKSLYCDNSDKAFLIKKGRCSPDAMARIYYCPMEYFDEVQDVIEGMEKEGNEYRWLEWEDAYIKGGQFLPGKVRSMGNTMGPDGDNIINEVRDLTPCDVTGYTHIDMSNNSERSDFFKPIFSDSGADDRDWKNLDSFVSGNDLYEDDEVWNIGARHVEYGKDCTLYYSERISLGEDFEKQLFVTASYNIFEDYGLFIYAGYGLAFILAVFLSLAIAYRNYMIYEAQYQMDAYRRATTNAMAHDLKSPLTAISGYAENLKNNVHTEKRDYYADAISENVQYMNHMIENILELAKAENAGPKTECAELDIELFVQEQLKKQEVLIEEKEIEVTVTGSGKALTDETGMIQIVDNLIGNAVKYTRNAGRISIRIADNTLEITNDMTGELNVPVVELWKPFVKGDDSRSGKQGTGIGLTIVKTLLEGQGGTLVLETEEDTFIARVLW